MSAPMAEAPHHHLASTMWAPMQGQTWLEAAASFLAMWTPMMAVMMAPVLASMLWRYSSALSATGEARLAAPIGVAGAAYLFVWTVLGLLVFPLGAAFAAIELRLAPASQLTSIATGAVVMFAGALQFTPWKARLLACCRDTPVSCVMRATTGSAWRHGLRLGLHCTSCCAGFTVMLLVFGIMDMGAMAVVTAAITAERLAPNGERVAQAIGVVSVLAGLTMIGGS